MHPRAPAGIGPGAVAVLAVLSGACGGEARDRSPTATLDGVEVTGFRRGDGEVAAFLGLPFAAPPVGARRWRPPQSVEYAAPFDATAFAPACMQGSHIVDWYGDLMDDLGADRNDFPVPEFSEDCLYLNVWTPAVDEIAKLPVMVWIHGGGHRGGWAYEPNYLGERLAGGGAVVVSIPYRLDVFGFFSHPDVPQSNFGLLDQIAALEWIAEHVAAFGGDPDNVTLFGESAGAASAGYLMVSPKAQGLFHRVIHQSGGYEYIHDDRRADFFDEGVALSERVAGGDIDALRAAPAERLLAAAREVYADYQPDAVVDGDTLEEQPAASLAAGNLHPVDVIVGSNADEWKMYLDAGTGPDDVDAWLAEHAARPDAVRALLGDDDPRRQLDRLITARQFVCPSLALADAARAAGRRAYAYYFSRVRPGEMPGEVGAYHGAEIPYVFGTHDDWLPTAAIDRALGDTMRAYWLRFAATGDPNVDSLPGWPAWDPTTAEIIEFGEGPRSVRHPEQALCHALAATGDAP